ncbi:hypothetical protein BW21_4260 [Burkholderia humptydooensis]|nr:hypothetical protein BW21_4260 [Burkholderia sp. 2002721687]
MHGGKVTGVVLGCALDIRFVTPSAYWRSARVRAGGGAAV